jgi:hypothetical protein
MEAKQAAEMQIAAVHDVERARLESNVIQRQHVMRTPVSNVDEGRNTAAQIQQGMHFDGATRLLVGGPWTERKTEINRGRVQRVDRIAEFDAKRLIGIERSSDADQNLRQIGVHTPVTALVGICQSRTRNLAANAKVVEFAGNSTQA